MAFQPVRLTHPVSRETIVATCAADYSNFLYRDGYVRATDQSGLGGKDAVASDTSAPETKPESPADKRKREQEEAAKAKPGAATNTN